MKRYIIHFIAIFIFIIGAISCNKDDTKVFDKDSQGSEREIIFRSSLAKHLPIGDIECLLNKDSQELKLKAKHKEVNGCSVITFDDHLLIGDYILMSVSHKNKKGEATELEVGSKISIQSEKSSVFPDVYNDQWGLFGSGTKEIPYIVLSPNSLMSIDRMANYGGDTTKKYFLQVADIDFFSFYISDTGFKGICQNPSYPFRGYYDGAGHKMTYLFIERIGKEDQNKPATEHVSPTGLFCNVCEAMIKNLTIESPTISGQDWTGALVGAVVGQGGEALTSSSIVNCHLSYDPDLKNAEIYGRMYVGGLVGGVSENAALYIKGCTNDRNNIIRAASYELKGGFIGGIVGAGVVLSKISIDSCVNNVPINTNTSVCVGGVIGAGYDVSISNCVNNAKITNTYGASIGTGGIIGGSANGFVVTSINNAEVSGGRGVAGILGSTAYDIENELYADSYISSSHNYGDVNGQKSIGGIVGESQTVLFNCYNTGNISTNSPYSSDVAGGLIGYLPGGVVTGGANIGKVKGELAGGIVGTSHTYSIQATSNFGDIEGFDKTGGIIAYGGQSGIINYCANYGNIKNIFDKEAGGIAGKMGLTSDIDVPRIAQLIISETEAATMGVIELTEVGKNNVVASIIKTTYYMWGAVNTLKDGITACLNWESPEEIEGWKTSSDQLTSENTAAFDQKMYDELAKRTNLVYTGPVEIMEDNISKNFNDNIIKFTQALLIDENSKLYSDNSIAYLNELASKELIADQVVNITTNLFKGVMGVIGIFVPNTVCTVIELVGKSILPLVNYYHPGGEYNTIYVSQVVNFGEVTNGHGLLGVAGDRIRLKNSIQAGRKAINAFSDYSHEDRVKVESLVSIGESDISGFYDDMNSDNYTYKLSIYNGNDSDFVNGNAFSRFDNNLWKVQCQTNFETPYNSRFLNFQ